MTSLKDSFIVSIVGESGAKALKKASERSNDLGSIIPPRVIIGWLKFLDQIAGGFDGALPGINNSYLNLKKSGDSFEGDIALDGGVFNFKNYKLEQVAALVASAVGVVDCEFPKELKDVELARLGKSIDLLIKSKVVADELKVSNLLTKAGGEAKGDASGSGASKAQPGKGAAAAPIAPIKAAKPTPTQKAGIKTKSTMTLSEKEAEKECSVCGSSQKKNGKLRGCFCFRDLIKKTEITFENGNYLLKFGDDWDKDSIITFRETVGKNV